MLERIQGPARKLESESKDLTYEERRKNLQLITLEESTEKGDLIMVYKSINQLEEVDNKGLLLRREAETRGGMKQKEDKAKRRSTVFFSGV